MLTLAQDLGTLTSCCAIRDLDSQEKRNVVDQKTLFAGERAPNCSRSATGPSRSSAQPERAVLPVESLMAELVFLLAAARSSSSPSSLRRAAEGVRAVRRRYLARSVAI